MKKYPLTHVLPPPLGLPTHKQLAPPLPLAAGLCKNPQGLKKERVEPSFNFRFGEQKLPTTRSSCAANETVKLHQIDYDRLTTECPSSDLQVA